MVNGPFKTGNEPTSIAIDPRGIYIYLTNSLDETVSAYSIALPTGTPSAVRQCHSGTAGNTTDTEPGVDRRRAGARPLCLHRQLSRQFRLRLPAQPQ